MHNFGIDPVEIDVDPDGYDGPASHVAPLLHRAGWLRVSEARFAMPFVTWRRTLTACVADDGAVLPQRIASRLFAMPSSLPRAPQDWPPDELDEVSNDLFSAFLDRTAIDNLLHLEEAKERGEARISRFDARAAALLAKLEALTRALRAERRRPDLDAARLPGIDGKLDRLAAMGDEIATETRRRAAAIRGETDGLEVAILAAPRGRGELDHRTTVRWRCLPRRWGRPVRIELHGHENERWGLVVRDQSTLISGFWR